MINTFQSENIDIKSISNVANVMLRHWKSIQDTFTNLNMLKQLWMLMESMKLRKNKPLYEINKSVRLNQDSIYKDKKCNVSDPNHCFLLREFQNMLLRLSS